MLRISAFGYHGIGPAVLDVYGKQLAIYQSQRLGVSTEIRLQLAIVDRLEAITP